MDKSQKKNTKKQTLPLTEKRVREIARGEFAKCWHEKMGLITRGMKGNHG